MSSYCTVELSNNSILNDLFKVRFNIECATLPHLCPMVASVIIYFDNESAYEHGYFKNN